MFDEFIGSLIELKYLDAGGVGDSDKAVAGNLDIARSCYALRRSYKRDLVNIKRVYRNPVTLGNRRQEVAANVSTADHNV